MKSSKILLKHQMEFQNTIEEFRASISIPLG